jgi:cytochrome c-type biogenesis protein CcmH
MGSVVRRRALVGLLIGGLCAAGLAGTPARAESYAYDLAGELMSPFCPGRTLASCPSPQAGELIQWIATQEAAGATRAEVRDMLVERFGEEILGAPPAEGITLWAYVFPVAGFLVFGAVAFLVLRRIVAPSKAREPGAPADLASAGAAAPSAGADASDDELARLVEAELASRS